MKFADIHCHPTAKLFALWSLENDDHLSHVDNHPWRLDMLKNHRRNLRRGKRATAYSQADFGKGIYGKTKISFASLYPFEQVFFKTIS